MKTNPAFFSLSEYHLLEPFFHAFFPAGIENGNIVFPRINRESVEPPEILRIRVDIGIQEHCRHLVSLGAKIVQRHHKTWGTTGVKQDFHEKGCLLSHRMI